VAGVITASEPSWIAPFTGLSPRLFGKLVTVLRREGADAVGKGRPWSLPLEDRALLVAVYWRTNLTMRQLAPSRLSRNDHVRLQSVRSVAARSTTGGLQEVMQAAMPSMAWRTPSPLSRQSAGSSRPSCGRDVLDADTNMLVGVVVSLLPLGEFSPDGRRRGMTRTPR
jgi:hypothetical protein